MGNVVQNLKNTSFNCDDSTSKSKNQQKTQSREAEDDSRDKGTDYLRKE